MRELPVFKALNHALKSTIDNRGFAFHVSWPWMAIILPLNIATTLYLIFNDLRIDFGAEPDLTRLSEILIVSLPLTIVSFIAYASIAVSWHRYILLDEVPNGWARIRIDALTWRYIGNFFLMFLMICGGALAIILILTMVVMPIGFLLGPQFAMIIYSILMLAAYVFGFVAFYRLSIKLPGIALGRTDLDFGDVWRVTEENFWQLLGLLFLMVVLFLVLNILLSASAPIFAAFGNIGLIIAIASQVVISWISTIFGVTLLTSLYGFFVENRDF